MRNYGLISLKSDGGSNEPHFTLPHLLSHGKMSTLSKIVVIVSDCKSIYYNFEGDACLEFEFDIYVYVMIIV